MKPILSIGFIALFSLLPAAIYWIAESEMAKFGELNVVLLLLYLGLLGFVSRIFNDSI